LWIVLRRQGRKAKKKPQMGLLCLQWREWLLLFLIYFFSITNVCYNHLSFLIVHSVNYSKISGSCPIQTIFVS